MELQVIDFSLIDLRIIQNLWEKKSVQYIANMLDKPMAAVQRKVDEMNQVHKVKLFEFPHFERKILPKRADKELLEEKVVKIPSCEGKISVRIDHKTIVMVKPGTDVEAYKREYLKRRSRAIHGGDE